MKNDKKVALLQQGMRIREARKAKSLTQTELGILCGYSECSTIHKIEKGLQDVPVSKEARLCKALDITSDYLRGVTIADRQMISYKSLLDLLDNAEKLHMSLHDFKESVKDWQNMEELMK